MKIKNIATGREYDIKREVYERMTKPRKRLFTIVSNDEEPTTLKVTNTAKGTEIPPPTQTDKKPRKTKNHAKES